MMEELIRFWPVWLALAGLLMRLETSNVVLKSRLDTLERTRERDLETIHDLIQELKLDIKSLQEDIKDLIRRKQ